MAPSGPRLNCRISANLASDLANPNSSKGRLVYCLTGSNTLQTSKTISAF
jgi:hypothetical protein